MNTFIRNEGEPSSLKRILGHVAFGALLLQLMVPGLFGIGNSGVETASAQAATSTLTVTKVVDGGTAAVADFDLFVTSDTGTTTPVTSGAEASFEAGDYTVTETSLAGYTATFTGDCAADGTITLTAGADAECTITNTFDEPAATTTSLTVTKVVDGGDMVADDFELFVNATPVTSGVALEFAPGTAPTAPLEVSETPVADYTASFSGDCDVDGMVSITEGEELECVITNTFTGTTTATTTSLTVTKVVDGGDMVAGDFELFINDTVVTSGVPLVFASTTLPTEPLEVSETPVDGYTASFSGDCDIDGMVTIVEGDELECVMTNTFTGTTTATTTSLTVTKVVEGGGSLDVDDFPLFVNGMSLTSGVATTTLAAGTYFVTETGNGDYTASFSGDCAANGAVTLELGVDAECVLTNTFVGSTGGSGGGGGDDDDDNNINITVEGSDANATGGEVNINVDDSTPFLTAFPGQVLGAQSFIPTPAPFVGQVLGAQSAVPGLPTTGFEPVASERSAVPNLGLISLAGLLAVAGAGLILAPRSSSSPVDRRRGQR